MSFNMLYEMLRNRHKKSLYDIHKTRSKKKTTDIGTNIGQIEVTQKNVTVEPKRNIATLFWSEFRFIILTVLIVVAALTMQETVQDALEVYVRSKFKEPGKRIRLMFLFSFLLVVVVIFIVILWKPAHMQLE